MGETEAMPGAGPSQDDLYRQVAESYGPALERLACAYEADPEERRDLLQDIHAALWRSFEGFQGRCSLRTWVYRVAHNVVTCDPEKTEQLDVVGWAGRTGKCRQQEHTRARDEPPPRTGSAAGADPVAEARSIGR